MLAWLQESVASHLPKGRVARSIITLVSGTAMAQVITICAMPVVTRLYTPAQIGVISLFLSFYGFWGVTLSLRYEYALLIAATDVESHVVCRLAELVVVGLSVLGFPILWALKQTNFLGFGLLPNWAPWAAVPILLGNGWFMVYRSWALRASEVKAITSATIIRSVFNSGGRVFLGLFALGVPALFVALFASAWASLTSVARRVTGHFAESRPAHITRPQLAAVAQKFVKFPLFEAPSALVDQLGAVLPVPMVAALHGAAAAGWFGLARMLVGIPNTQIGNAVADVFQMELAHAVVGGDASRARGLFYKLMVKLAAIGLLPLIAIMAVASWAVPWAFGNRWSAAGVAAACIAPWLYAALIVGPLSRALSVLQAQEFKLIYDILAVVFLVAAFFLSQEYHYSFVGTVVAITAMETIAYVVYGVVLVVVVESRLRTAAL